MIAGATIRVLGSVVKECVTNDFDNSSDWLVSIGR